jgi:O-antigen ligase
MTLTRKYETWILLPVTCALLVLAEYSRYLTTTKVTALILAPRTLLIVGGALLFIWLLLNLKSLKNIFNIGDWWWLGVPIALSIWSVIGLLWTEEPTARTYLAEYWLYGLFLAVLIGIVGRTARNLKWLSTSVIIGIAGVIVIALIEKITDTHLPLSNLHNPYREQWAVTSVFINQNHLAASLVLLLPLIFGFGVAQKGWRRWAVIVIALLGVVVFFFTGSILGALSLSVSVLVFLLIAMARLPFFSQRRIGSGLSIIVALVFIGFVWTSLPKSISDRFSPAAEGVRKSIAERLDLATNSFTLMEQEPLRGLGPGGAEKAIRELDTTRVQNAHSLFLEIGVNFGLPALFIFVVWRISSIISLLWRISQKFDWRLVGVTASLIGFFLAQAIPSNYVGVRAPFIVIGFSIALINMRKQ